MSKISLLLLSGVAAFAAYKYSKLSEAEKKELIEKLKQKGKKMYDQFAPGNIKDTVKNL
jgi:hypothetical protein